MTAFMPAFEHLVTTEAELRAIAGGHPSERAKLKDRGVLDAQSRGFLALSPFLLIATSGVDGACDVSPKGDAPGFVRALDDTRLLIPERNGNKRFDSLKNLLTNPNIGVLFLVPGCDYTLRVNGRGWITRDQSLLDSMPAQGVTPKLAIGVEVQEAYFHCVKSFRRSRLWTKESWPAADALPSYACTVFNQIRPADATLEEYERSVAESDAKLYV
jgi:PPOX class probable FMN-dependent enzyme